MAIEQTLWWAHVSVSEMLQPLFATCLVRSQTCLLRNESILEAWGLHRNEPNELQSSSQIMSRTGADDNRPLLLSIPISEHLGGEDSGAATQNAIYSISLLIITHHYSSLRNSLLIITHHYSNSITHHYTRWVKTLLRCLKISCHKTFHTQRLLMKIERGVDPPPRFLCVMMSKKEIYE